MPRRLNQNRGKWGVVSNSCNNQNDIQMQPNIRTKNTVLNNVFEQNGMSGTGLGLPGLGLELPGAGILSKIRKATEIGQRVGEIGQKIGDVSRRAERVVEAAEGVELRRPRIRKQPARMTAPVQGRGMPSAMVQNRFREIVEEGFGLPGDLLREKIIKDIVRKKRKAVKKSGQGLNIPGGRLEGKAIAKKLGSLVVSKFLPMLLKKLGLSQMSGKGRAKMSSMVHMNMLRALNDGASRKTTRTSKNAIAGRGKTKKLLKKLKPAATTAAKLLLPILVKMATKKFSGSGKAMSFAELKRRHENPSLVDRLGKQLTMGIFNFLKNSIMGKSGSGMCGAGFFDGFKKGFMSVISPTLKVAKTLAPIAPLLL